MQRNWHCFGCRRRFVFMLRLTLRTDEANLIKDFPKRIISGNGNKNRLETSSTEMKETFEIDQQRRGGDHLSAPLSLR